VCSGANDHGEPKSGSGAGPVRMVASMLRSSLLRLAVGACAACVGLLSCPLAADARSRVLYRAHHGNPVGFKTAMVVIVVVGAGGFMWRRFNGRGS
jgi:hypothetical protein